MMELELGIRIIGASNSELRLSSYSLSLMWICTNYDCLAWGQEESAY